MWPCRWKRHTPTIQHDPAIAAMGKEIFLTTLLLAIVLGAGVIKAQDTTILVLEIEGPVTPAMASYFERGIETAENSDVAALLVTLDTPGGNIDPMQAIVQTFRRASVPIIVYIAPRGAQAASAGSVITMAAHFAAMAPETVIGAASPVGEGGSELGETILRKLTEDLSAQVRSLAARRGEAATTLAEAMIREARAVNAREALEVGLIDAVAEDIADLLIQLDGRTATIDGQTITLKTAGATQRYLSMTVIEQVLHALSNPLLVSTLLVIGVPAILIELSSPGGWVAGAIGVLSLALAFYGLGQLPANWFGLGLLAGAFVLFALEVKAPAHGALAIAGTATMVSGLLILFNSPGTPQFARLSIPGAISISLFTAMFFIFLVTKALRAQQIRPATGLEGLSGQTGLVRTALTSATSGPPYTGSILVKGELWRATADEPMVKGEAAVVTAVQGFTVHLKKSDRTP